MHEEIYVQSVTPSGGVWQVSKGVGAQPFWRKDGKELFYLDENNLMAVEVETQSATFRAGTPHVLFALRPSVTAGARYQVAANGQRFLVINPIETPPSPITVAVNWTARLRK
jgi:hypothetical protein